MDGPPKTYYMAANRQVGVPALTFFAFLRTMGDFRNTMDIM